MGWLETGHSVRRGPRTGWLVLISVVGRVLAQLIVLGLWWGGMSQKGVNPEGPTGFSISLWFAAIPTVPPAMVIGALDGVGWAMKTRWRAAVLLRIGAPLLLVLYSLIWISFVGSLATATGEVPAMPTYRGALVGMELALAAELLTFVTVRVSVGLLLWWRG